MKGEALRTSLLGGTDMPSLTARALLLIIFATMACSAQADVEQECPCPGYLLSSWDAGSGELRWSVDIPDMGWTPAFAVSNDSARIATVANVWDGRAQGLSVSIWDTSNGELVRDVILDASLPIGANTAFSPDLRWLGLVPFSAAGSQFMLWDLETGEIHSTFDGVSWAAFSNDSSRFLAYSAPDNHTYGSYLKGTTAAPAGIATWWDIETHTQLGSVQIPGLPLKLSSTGKLLVGVSSPADKAHERAMSLILVDVEGTGEAQAVGERAYRLFPFGGELDRSFVFSADSTVMALAGVGYSPQAWTGSPLSRTLLYRASNVQWRALSPRGDKLLFQHGIPPDTKVDLLDVAEGQLVSTFDHPTLVGAKGAVFVSDGNLLTMGWPCPCLRGL